MGVTESKEPEFSNGLQELKKVVEAIHKQNSENKTSRPVPLDKNIVRVNHALTNILFSTSLQRRLLTEEIYTLIILPEHDPEYVKIKNFCSLSSRSWSIKSIAKMENPYLFAIYNLKKQELMNRHTTIRETLLYHGTESCKIDGIFSNNLNYRLCGTSLGTRFGRGVSFTNDFHYATHYCDKFGLEKNILVCNVLRSNSHVGDQLTFVPRENYDTTTNSKGNVFVKYDDDVYYPMYKITFH